MKICLVTLANSVENCGAERSLLATIDTLKEWGVECFIMLPSHGGLLSRELKSRGIPYCVIPYKWWTSSETPWWKRLGRTILHIAMAVPVAVKIRRWQCDIVYTNTISICVGAFAAALIGRPHVWHIRELGYEDHNWVFDLGQNLSLWLVDKLSSICIVNSKAVAEKYQQFITPSKVKVVYQSVSVTLAV